VFTWPSALPEGGYEVVVETDTCGLFDIDNTAAFTNTETAGSGSDTVTVDIDIPCPGGCTLTQGYWKTHNPSFWGGASTKADDGWFALGDEETVEIHGDDHAAGSYFAIMWTPPKGNVWYQLAHQMIAAELNVENGADPTIPATNGYTSVAAAIDAAKILLASEDPFEIAEKTGKDKAAFKKSAPAFLQLASLFGAYNEGQIGPGHCAEDAVSDLG
jgi:hypothetical protein